jgi:predicted negative regulator of RcsB-dependent stress response
MAYDLEEQEQLARMKAWWDKYGSLTLGLLSLALATVLGWQAWNWYNNNQAQQARGYYEALEKAAADRSDDGLARIQAATSALQQNFGRTDYAARGALIASNALAARGQTEAAREPLDWLASSAHPALAPLARLRLAGLLLDQGEYAQALAQLDAPPEAFEALYADRRGDILMAQGELEQARDAWRQALNRLQPGDALAAVVQLKLDTIGS